MMQVFSTSTKIKQLNWIKVSTCTYSKPIWELGQTCLGLEHRVIVAITYPVNNLIITLNKFTGNVIQLKVSLLIGLGMSALSCPLLWSIAVSVILQFNTKVGALHSPKQLRVQVIFTTFKWHNFFVSSSVNVVCDFVPV